jgi:thiosulfate dehydrogenase (quinone) large subunit
MKNSTQVQIIPTPRNDMALAVLRSSVGIIFIILGQYKVFGTGFTLGGGFQYWVKGFLDGRAYPFMVPVLRDFVVPHAVPIAFLVAYGELAIGLALVIGVWVRQASLFGLVYMLALLFSANYPVASDYPDGRLAFWEYFGAACDHLVPALCFATFAFGRADRALSLASCLREMRSGRSL